MAITMPGSITGSAQTGFTTPGYTCLTDNPPSGTNSKQIAVSAVTGTQTGVDAHSAGKPFTVTVEVGPPAPNPVANASTGILTGRVARRVMTVRTRKGMLVLAGQTPQVGIISTRSEIPAGADLVEPANIRALASCHIGFINQLSSGYGDTLVTGIF